MVWIGIILASTGQGLQCIVIAPKILAAISQDALLPFLKPLSFKFFASRKPLFSIIFTYLLSTAIAMTGKLDSVVPILAFCFLMMYSLINFACVLMTVLEPASWKPKGYNKKRWRTYYILVGFLGGSLSLVLMFVIQWWGALIIIGLAAAIFIILEWREAKED